MERLTDYQKAQKWLEGYDWDNDPTANDNLATICEALQEMQEYEDLEKRGLILKLPCKVGDMVYTNTSMQGWYFRKENRPYEANIVFIGINGVDNFMNVDFGNGRMLQFKFSKIGKTVFLTQAEAEEALKGMEGENETD